MSTARREILTLLGWAVACSIACLLPGAVSAEPPIALRGYDPVAYFTVGKPVRGTPEIAHEWDEQRYLFSTKEHRERFKAEPLRYVPQFAHLCTMALTRGKVIDANPEYWVISDGKLYLFSQPIGPDLFRQAPADNVEKAALHYRVQTQKR